MSSQQPETTIYPQVNRILGLLLSGLNDILGSELTGLYLFGSLATGDFIPHNSDIDCLIVTEREVDPALYPALAALHEQIAGSDEPLAKELEGSYMDRSALRRHDPDRSVHLRLERGGQLRLEKHDMDWIIQRYMLRTQGVTVAGAPIRDLIDPISEEELRRAILDLLSFWWAPMVKDPAILSQSPGYQTYAVLTMCRILHTLEVGGIVPKRAAARRVLEWVDEPWNRLIQAALVWVSQPPDKDGRRAPWPEERLVQVQAFVGYVVERVSRG